MRRIVELGNAQLVECGAGGLSVREIARGLGMVSSAVYRYVRSRDELLTLLIVDAYGDLADAVDGALAEASDAPRERFTALAESMAQWAIAHPERWTLLYGTPVSGYDAPAESTNADGTRVMARMLAIAAAADADAAADAGASAGRGEGVHVTPDVRALLDAHLEEFGVESDAMAAMRAVTAWSSLVGIISAHVFRQLGADAAAIGEQILGSQTELLADLVIGR
ncbi:TetR/AcrR family transcriptional regulator [Brachybacterium alimentarium]|uniref:TetR/AcrR family transcriptional regulator n=1 Tax=Brachybacterium alimentarium TaxID=47845 RepID=UPI003FD176EB